MDRNDEELERALAGISGDLDAQPREEQGGQAEQPASQPQAEAPAEQPTASPNQGSSASGNLQEVRNSVLVDLQPLATQINLPNNKKFELLMQIYEATRDQKLIELAYQAGRAIENEGERADALLRVIKEIDSL